MVRSRALILCAVLLSLVTAASPAMASCSGPSLFEGYLPVAMDHQVNELAVADVDNDGETDLITVSTAGTINVRLGNGGGSFDSVLSYPAPNPEEVAVGDLNGDGFADIVVSHEPGVDEECTSFGGCAGFSVLLNDGDGTFGTATTTIVPFSSSIVSIDVANFGGENLDVLVGAPPINSTDPAIHVFHSDGDGGFDDRTSWSVDGNGQLFDVEAVYINGPSAVANIVAIAGPGSTSSSTRALVYGVGPTLLRSHVLTTDVLDGEVASGDFNRDGSVDVAAMTRQSTGQSRVAVWLQNLPSGSSFMSRTAFFTDLAVGDPDEDGDLDIMVAQGSDDWLVLKMNNYIFEIQPTGGSSEASATITRVVANDFNRDGRMDFLFLDTANDVVRLLTNTCQARYATITLNSSPNPSVFGSDATFTVSVQGRENAPVPDGGVTLYEGDTVRGTGTLNDAGNAFITLSNLSVGSHTLRAVYDGGIGDFGSVTSANYVHTVSEPPFGPPPGLTATGNGAANQITITWTATANTASYDVLRRENGAWMVIANVGGPPYVQTTNIVNTSAYVYAVRARHTNGTEVSAESNSDIATTATLALPGDKKIRATDVTTTRSLITSLRAAAGLSAFPYTDTSLTSVTVKAIHYTELRDTLNPARTLLGFAPVTFPDNVAAGQIILRTDIVTIRNSFQ